MSSRNCGTIGRMSQADTQTKKNKKSSVRHTRAIQRERRIHQPACLPPEEFEKELTRLVYPAALAQQGDLSAVETACPHSDLAGDGRPGTFDDLAASRRHLRVDAPGAERSVALDSRAPGDPTGNF